LSYEYLKGTFCEKIIFRISNLAANSTLNLKKISIIVFCVTEPHIDLKWKRFKWSSNWVRQLPYFSPFCGYYQSICLTYTR